MIGRVSDRGVPNPGAPVRSRAPLKSAWQVLLGSKEKFTAFIETLKEDNKDLMTRMSPSAQRKQRTAVDHWRNLLDVLDPVLDEGHYCYWDTDIVESNDMHMPVLVRTPCTNIFLFILIILQFEIFEGRGLKTDNEFTIADTLLFQAMQFANAICPFGRDPQTKPKAGSESKLVYGGFLQVLLSDQTYTSEILSESPYMRIVC